MQKLNILLARFRGADSAVWRAGEVVGKVFAYIYDAFEKKSQTESRAEF